MQQCRAHPTVSSDFIYVDPAKLPRNESFVVARLGDSKEATFKQYIIEGEHKYLQALSPAWLKKIITIY